VPRGDPTRRTRPGDVDHAVRRRKYRDTYERELRRLIDQKRKGKDVTVAEAPENVLDLMAALEASLQKKGRSRTRTKRTAAARKTHVRKTPARKAGKRVPKKTGTKRRSAA
jgi:DNA end-binding protein Ku